MGKEVQPSQDPPDRSDVAADVAAEQEVVATPEDLNLKVPTDTNDLWLENTEIDILWHDGGCDVSHAGTPTSSHDVTTLPTSPGWWICYPL